MTDILERIDWLYVAEIEAASPDPDMVKTYADAKAEIEHLRADNEQLRAALTRLVAWEGPVELACPELGGLLKAMYDARAALEANDE